MAGAAVTEIRPIVFRSREGLGLHGILHLPAGEPKKEGIIILSPGIKSRVAPHRLYLKMSRRFVELGFPVFRFDPEGMGDSEGEINEKLAADVYGSIQVGRFVSNTGAAMDWMQKELGIRSFILSGLCGGAITGLLAGAGDNRVDSLLGLGIPVILDGSKVDKSRFLTKSQTQSIKRDYLRKIFDLRAWGRLLSFRSDYKLLFRVFAGGKGKGAAEGEPPSAVSSGEQGNFNSLFPRAFEGMSRSRRICLIFSEADRLYWEFEEKFAARHEDVVRSAGKNLELHIIKNANHVFTFKEWQESAFDTMCGWLSRNYR